MPKIIFNGKSYDRAEDMPPEARQAYQRAMGRLEDKNQNGVPDVLEGGRPVGKITLNSHVRISTTRKIVLNGQVYNSVDEMPAETRQAYEKALGTLDANQNGVPDMLEGNYPPASFSTQPITATPPIIPAVPTDMGGGGEQRLRRLAVTLVLLLLVAAGLAAIVINLWLSRVPR